jgi:opine dehydrogenase
MKKLKGGNMVAKVAVLGSGNGGLAAAAHLAKEGHQIFLYSRNKERLKPIQEAGGLQTSGAIGEDFVKLSRVTSSLAEAVNEADVLLVVVPATGHNFYAKSLAPYLQDGQLIVLNPGSTGGTLNFMKCLVDMGCRAKIKLAETNTLTYACRTEGTNSVRIYSFASNIMLGVFPSRDTKEVSERFRQLYPGIQAADNVLETSMTNLNAVIHPPGMVLNAGWIQRTNGDFFYYYEGTTQAVADLMQAVDEERLLIMKALDLKPIPFLQRFYEAGYTSEQALKENSIYLAFKDSQPNRWIKSPSTISHRYLTEDVPFGLVPMTEIACKLGIATPAMDAIISVSSILNKIDFRTQGLTAEKMGIAYFDKDKLIAFVEEGF